MHKLLNCAEEAANIQIILQKMVKMGGQFTIFSESQDLSPVNGKTRIKDDENHKGYGS